MKRKRGGDRIRRQALRWMLKDSEGYLILHLGVFATRGQARGRSREEEARGLRLRHRVVRVKVATTYQEV